MIQERKFKVGIKEVLFGIMCLFMALYPIYTNYHKGLGLAQYARHIGFLTGDILFPNPWQYRVLSHWVIEGIYEVYHFTIGRIVDIESLVIAKLPGETDSMVEQTKILLGQLKSQGFITYNLIFILVRVLQHLLIFGFTYLLYKKFLKSDWVIFLGIMLISLFLGNSVNDSDLAFNTYFDIIFYLAAGYIIMGRKNGWYILPLTILGAFNRETSVLIPFMYFISQVNWQSIILREIKLSRFFPDKKTMLITATSYIFFWSIFVGLRLYYGWEEYQGIRGETSGWAILRINMLSPVSIKSYFEMYGTFIFLPFIFLYKFKEINWTLKVWFLALVPIWFGVHLWSAVAYQSRLFLVPTILVLLPGVLEVIEKSIFKHANQLKQEPSKVSST